MIAFYVIACSPLLASTKCFIVMENDAVYIHEGDCDTRHSPCSTFKIPLSLMGFEEGILVDENNPMWPFQEGYVDFIDSWKQPHNPSMWIKNSCVWYSQVLTTKMGLDKFKHYVELLDYGNQDISGEKGKNNGLTHSWLSSSLKISGMEQIIFLHRFITFDLPFKRAPQELTQKLLFTGITIDGWDLYGKTGVGYKENPDGTLNMDLQAGWFIGWLKKDNRIILFVHYLEDDKHEDTFAGKRAKEMVIERLKTFVKTLPS
jgi:beta-lactamase class D